MRASLEAGGLLSSREKAAFDRRLGRILSRLPLSIGREAIELCLRHRRKSRRDAASKAMKKRVATCELAEDLMSLYDPTKDDDVLKLIIRSPEVAMALGVAYLFNALAKSELSHEYWRMRVIELLIKSDRSEAARLAGDYPREFIWAVGRLQDSDGLATAIELLDPNKQDLDFLSLSAWTFGRLQSEEGLKAIRAVLNN